MKDGRSPENPLLKEERAPEPRHWPLTAAAVPLHYVSQVTVETSNLAN